MPTIVRRGRLWSPWLASIQTRCAVNLLSRAVGWPVCAQSLCDGTKCNGSALVLSWALTASAFEVQNPMSDGGESREEVKTNKQKSWGLECQ